MDQAADILRSYLRVTQHLSQQFRNTSASSTDLPQAMVLTVLGESGPMPISTLAEKTGSANSTISGVVGPAGEAGAGPADALLPGPPGDLCAGHPALPEAAGAGAGQRQ